MREMTSSKEILTCTTSHASIQVGKTIVFICYSHFMRLVYLGLSWGTQTFLYPGGAPRFVSEWCSGILSSGFHPELIMYDHFVIGGKIPSGSFDHFVIGGHFVWVRVSPGVNHIRSLRDLYMILSGSGDHFVIWYGAVRGCSSPGFTWS